jgi:hypothetical protein
MTDQIVTGVQWVVDDATGAITGYRRKINGVDTAFALDSEAIQSQLSRGWNSNHPEGSILADIAAQSAYSPDFVFVAASDSTGNESDEKIRRLADYIAAQFPGAWVDYRLIDTGTDLYGAPTKLSSGGVEPSISVGVDLRGWAYPVSIVGMATDIDFRATLAPASWAAGTQVIGGQYGNAGSRAWYAYLNSSGFIGITWVEADNVTTKTYLSTVATGFAAGSRGSIRVTVDVDNGATGHSVAFYKSTDDGITWTQLGTTTVTAGVSSIYQPANQNYELGSRGAANGAASTGGAVGGASGTVFYSAHFSPTIGGYNRLPCNIRDWWGTSGMTGVRSAGMAIRFYNGAYPGQNFAYFLTGTRLEAMIPHAPDNAVFICNTSHNEGSVFQAGVFEANAALFKTRLDARLLKYRGVISSQNPQLAPKSAEQIYAQMRRCTRSIPAVAAAYGWALSDEYRLTVWSVPGAIQPDGVHPESGVGLGREAQGNCLIRACGGVA